MSNKSKLEQVFGRIQPSKWNDAARERRQNRHWLRYSQEIALAVLDKLDQLNVTQRELAEKMNVSPQLVNKWLKGAENFTLETISKIEAALEVSLLHIEVRAERFIVSTESNVRFSGAYESPEQDFRPAEPIKTAKVITMPQTEYLNKVV